MKALPILLGIGAVVLIGSKSSKSSNSTEKVIPKTGKALNTVKNTEPVKCTSVQYMNKEGICQAFWDDKTSDLVKKQLDIELKGYDSENWDLMCQQVKSVNEISPNPNHVKILTNVIVKLWPQIKVSDLPPSNKSPLYILVLWQKATAVYYDMVCGVADLPPIT